VLKMYHAREVTSAESPELFSMVRGLAERAGLPMPKVYIVNSPMANAFATGRDPEHAAVAVTTGIMERLNESELEAVLAHELTHVKNRDMMVMTIATFLSSVAQILVQWLPFLGMGGDDREGNSGGAVLMFVVSLVVWIVSFILIRTLSRYREFAADRGAAIITGQPSQLISALKKISGFRVPTQDLRKVEGPVSALFITPAISGSSIMKLFSTHPPLEARIAALERIEMELEA